MRLRDAVGTTKQKVIAALDAPKVERTGLVDAILVAPEPITADPFRAFLAEHRLEQSTRGRTAHRVLLMGHGARPCKPGVKELIRLGLEHVPAKWISLYTEFSGDRSIVLADLMPPAETAKRTAEPQYRYRADGEPPCGVIEIRQTAGVRFAAMKNCIAFRVARRIPTGNPPLFSTVEEACSCHDSMVRARGQGRLNFRTEIDTRSAQFILKAA